MCMFIVPHVQICVEFFFYFLFFFSKTELIPYRTNITKPQNISSLLRYQPLQNKNRTNKRKRRRNKPLESSFHDEIACRVLHFNHLIWSDNYRSLNPAELILTITHASIDLDVIVAKQKEQIDLTSRNSVLPPVYRDPFISPRYGCVYTCFKLPYDEDGVLELDSIRKITKKMKLLFSFEGFEGSNCTFPKWLLDLRT